MGILNITPDSFYSGNRTTDEKDILKLTEKMLEDGAAFIDIGGFSSRPGAEYVSEEEEGKRIYEVVKLLVSHFKEIIISVDTYRSTIAKRVVEMGAAMINDISSGEDDPEMMKTIAKLQVPYIMMHKRGTPQTMQQLTQYDNVTNDVLDYFIKKITDTKELHIHDILIDPGFGFAKTIEQNYQLLNNLEIFRMLQSPLVAGLSRKKMIQHVIEADVEEALNGTSTANTIALLKGASILRVHDVKEAVQCVKIVEMLNH